MYIQYLIDFAERFNYNLLNILTYNSYRSGDRNYVRDYDSISVTEILSILEDPNMKFMNEFYSDKMKEAQAFGTKKHSDLENYFNGGSLNNKDNIDINFQVALIQYGIEIKESEGTYKKTYKDLPLITGDIDNISEINGQPIIIDYKISKNSSNFKSRKYELQKAGYRWLTGIQDSAILFLNKKNFEFKRSTDHDYYNKVWLDLLEYANYLYTNNKINNLYYKNKIGNKENT